MPTSLWQTTLLISQSLRFSQKRKRGKIPFLGGSRRLWYQVPGRHTTEVHPRLKHRVKELRNYDLTLNVKGQQGDTYYQKEYSNYWVVYIPAAGPWGRASGPRPGRTGRRESSPVPLTMYPVLISYFAGHQQHGKIIISLHKLLASSFPSASPQGKGK